MNTLLVRTSLVVALAAVVGSTDALARRGARTGAHAAAGTVTRAVQGRLLEGQRSNHYLWLDEGSRYLISGSCDLDCRDLDLRLFSPSGVEIDNDLLGDDVPVVSTTARRSGRYRVEVTMAHCAIQPCSYELVTDER